MRDTIKIDALRALVIEPAGKSVLVHVQTAGVRMFTQTLTADQAAVMAMALERCASRAEQGPA